MIRLVRKCPKKKRRKLRWTPGSGRSRYLQGTADFLNEGLWKIEDKVTPSKEYLEKKLQELENGEFRAENLSEVVLKNEVDPDYDPDL